MLQSKIRVLIFLLLLGLSNAYKIAIFTPDVLASQLIFNKRVAETFAKAGHDVKMYRIRAMGYKHLEVHVDQEIVNVADVIAYSDADFDSFHKDQGEFFFSEWSIFSSKTREAYQKFADLFTNSCAEMLQMKSFMLSLTEEHFDIAFAAANDYCSIGLIHAARIPTWVWLDAGPLTDFVAENIGVSSPPSFVPLEMADASDRMSFTQRFINVILRGAFPYIYDRALAYPQNEIFQKYVHPDFPNLQDLAKHAPLVMTNTHEFYEFPRPSLAKVVNLGGIGLSNYISKPLPAPFEDLVAKYDSIILFSFGTIADASHMSETWKNDILRAFAKFPKILFIMRYLDTDLNAVAPENVHLARWMPQYELLHHPKLKLFITHGGYNSFQEAIYASKPMIVIPLFGDQKRNANLIVKHGIGLRLDKSQVSENNLYQAIQTVLEDQTYSQKVTELNTLVTAKPFSAEETLLKWTDFLVKVKKVPNLTPASVDLSYIQYHNLDVFGIIGLVFITIFWILLSLVSRLLSFNDNVDAMKHEKRE